MWRATRLTQNLMETHDYGWFWQARAEFGLLLDRCREVNLDGVGRLQQELTQGSYWT